MLRNSELLSKLDPEVVRKFEEKQVRYVRYFPDKNSQEYLNWQQVYQTDDRRVRQREIVSLFSYYFCLISNRPKFLTL